VCENVARRMSARQQRTHMSDAGMAFFGSYICYLIVRRLSGFRYSTANPKVSLLFISIIAVVFCGLNGLPYRAATVFGILVLTATSIYSTRGILNLVSVDEIPRSVLTCSCSSAKHPSAPSLLTKPSVERAE
jgi:hypothetical protein